MYQIIIGTILAFLAVAGLAYIGQSIRGLFFMPTQNRVSFIITSRGHDESIEFLIRSLVFKVRGLHARISPVILIVDEGMDSETINICEKLSHEYDCLRVVKSPELAAVLQGEGGLTS